MRNKVQRKQELELWDINPAPRQRRGNVRQEYRPRAYRAYPNPRAAQISKRRRRRRRRRLFFRRIAIMAVILLSVGILFKVKSAQQNRVQAVGKPESFSEAVLDYLTAGNRAERPEIQEDFLTVSEYNRPGTKLSAVKNIFVHYTANPGTSAAQNRSYFENLGETHERSASAHFIIGCEGEIIQCIPLDEEAYAVIGRNSDSISIECCYVSKDGKFTQETYDSLVAMLAWLTDQYDLTAKDILRHYDCGGKRCPLYYVEHEEAWQQLLHDVGKIR